MQMIGAMTLLTSVSGHALIKSFSGTDIILQPISISSPFNVIEEDVSDLQKPICIATKTGG
jgi:hypothetical protein